MVRSMAEEMADRGITVNAVTSGAMDTPFLHGEETPESVRAIIGFTPMGRFDQVVQALKSATEERLSSQASWKRPLQKNTRSSEGSAKGLAERSFGSNFGLRTNPAEWWALEPRR